MKTRTVNLYFLRLNIYIPLMSKVLFITIPSWYHELLKLKLKNLSSLLLKLSLKSEGWSSISECSWSDGFIGVSVTHLHVLLVCHLRISIIWNSISFIWLKINNNLWVIQNHSMHPYSLWLKTFYISLCKITCMPLLYWVQYIFGMVWLCVFKSKSTMPLSKLKSWTLWTVDDPVRAKGNWVCFWLMEMLSLSW